MLTMIYNTFPVRITCIGIARLLDDVLDVDKENHVILNLFC